MVVASQVPVDTEAQEAVRKLGDAVKSAWSAAKDTVANGWDSFKRWITGGSGSGSTVSSYGSTSGATSGGNGVGGGHGEGSGESRA